MALIASACQTSSDDSEISEIDDNRINVIASMYPLEYFAERIGGDRVNVQGLIPPGGDAHDFEPTPGDLRDLAAADVLVYNGLGFESWIDALLESGESPNVTVQASAEDIGLHFETTTWNDDGHDDHVDDDDGHDDHADDDDGHDDHADDDDGHDKHADDDDGLDDHVDDDDGHDDHADDDDGHDDHADDDDGLGDHVDDDDGLDKHADDDDGLDDHADDDGHDDHADDDDGHDHSGLDPHVWLDPILAVTQASEIAAAFIKVDPDNTSYYESNLQTLTNDLTELNERFSSSLQACAKDIFVTSHDAFNYLANRYDKHAVGISGMNPESEPSPRVLAEISEAVTETGIEYVLVNPLDSERLSATLMRETGAQSLPLHTVQNLTKDERDTGESYMTLMNSNLSSLKTAMGCEG